MRLLAIFDGEEVRRQDESSRWGTLSAFGIKYNAAFVVYALSVFYRCADMLLFADAERNGIHLALRKGMSAFVGQCCHLGHKGIRADVSG